MRRAIGGLGALSLATLSLTFLAAGQAGADDKPSANFFTRLLPWNKPKPEPRKEEATAVAQTQLVQARLAAAKTSYFERLKVCNKLREVALQSGDDELLRKAEQLEIRVWDAYQGQMQRLAGGGGTLSAEEQALDRHLRGDTATGPRRAATESASRNAGAPTARR